MFIDVHELELRRIEFDGKFPPGAIDLAPDVRQAGPLSALGHAELVEEHHGGKGKIIQDIRLVGELHTGVELYCARCLEPVMREVDRAFDLLFRPQGSDSGEDERGVREAEAEIGYYEGNGLLLEDVLREQVLLALPMRAICRDDCRGLCPQCGQNRNTGGCACAPGPDARWEALSHIKDKLRP
jgi:uncharacterized protein